MLFFQGDAGKTMMLRGADGELREYEIIATKERESGFEQSCPVLPVPLAIVACLLNIVPGTFIYDIKAENLLK